MELFKKRLVEIHWLKSTIELLSWDQQTYMPPQRIWERANTTATLAAILHDKFTSQEFEQDLIRRRFF